jgi:class 3 adenylate cyclase
MINDLSQITKTYHSIQRQRIEVVRRRIQNRVNAAVFGHAIPSPLDLPIGQGRRLEAAVMFVDISGFTQRPSNTELEQDHNVRVLSLFFTETVRIIEDYGGVVEKNTGDGVMAYFSRRSGRGDLRQRAVACAMTIFHAADHFINPIIEASGLEPLAFRICADYGWITVARMGAAQRFSHIVAVGAPANRTSKMLSFAAADQLMVGGAMLQGLPEVWNHYLKLASLDTGWSFEDGTPYGFWVFNGRWNVLG